MNAVAQPGSVVPDRPAARRGKVLVVVPVLNEAAHIAEVLRQLALDLPADRPVQFVVCDGGSSDGTQAIVAAEASRRRNLVLLANPRRIQSAAVNLAARRFGHDADVLVRCDAHADYPPGFIALLVDSLTGSGADAVVVPMDSAGTGCLRRAIAWISDTPVGSGGSAHRGGRRSGWVDHGHHAAFRMGSFARAGGYDETFTHNEDAELDCRQRALGARIWLDADIRVRYLPRGTFGGLARQYFRYGRGRARTVRRHPGSIRVRQLAVPANLVLCLGAALAAWALPATLAPVALVWPVAYATVLAGAALALTARHRSACALLAAPAAATMHLAWAAGFLGGIAFDRERRWRPDDARPLALDGPQCASHLRSARGVAAVDRTAERAA